MSNAIRSQGTKIQRGVGSPIAAKVISTMKSVGTLVTAATTLPHGLNSGDAPTFAGAVPAAYNGTAAITVISPTSFTYQASSAPGGDATAVATYSGTTNTYTDVEEASDIKIGGVQVSSIDVTHLQSAAKEYIAGLLDNGSMDFSCNFTNGPVQQLLRQDMNNGVTSPYRMVIAPTSPTPINILFSCFMTKMDGPTAKTDGKMDLQCAAKITGAIIYA